MHEYLYGVSTHIGPAPQICITIRGCPSLLLRLCLVYTLLACHLLVSSTYHLEVSWASKSQLERVDEQFKHLQ